MRSRKLTCNQMLALSCLDAAGPTNLSAATQAISSNASETTAQLSGTCRNRHALRIVTLCFDWACVRVRRPACTRDSLRSACRPNAAAAGCSVSSMTCGPFLRTPHCFSRDHDAGSMHACMHACMCAREFICAVLVMAGAFAAFSTEPAVEPTAQLAAAHTAAARGSYCTPTGNPTTRVRAHTAALCTVSVPS